jgi:hypothetical protein
VPHCERRSQGCHDQLAGSFGGSLERTYQYLSPSGQRS